VFGTVCERVSGKQTGWAGPPGPLHGGMYFKFVRGHGESARVEACPPCYSTTGLQVVAVAAVVVVVAVVVAVVVVVVCGA
jgi:hypothetical protein